MIRPITDTLRLLDGGAFLDSASDKLNELVRRVDECGRSGKLTITLDIKRARAGAVNITPAVTTKLPEIKPDPSLLWVTVEGNLTPENPSQQKLDLRTVSGTPSEIREVDVATKGELRTATATPAH